MNEYENRTKRIKLQLREAKEIADQEEKMEKMQVDTEKKSNFSSINPSSGAIVRGGSGSLSVKGDIKKLVIKNFKCKFAIRFQPSFQHSLVAVCDA
jgi:hypothetical protein